MRRLIDPRQAWTSPHRMRCPYCGTTVVRERCAGRVGHEVFILICTSLDCHFEQRVAKDQATGVCMIVRGEDARDPRRFFDPGKRGPVACATPGCRNKALLVGGVCRACASQRKVEKRRGLRGGL